MTLGKKYFPGYGYLGVAMILIFWFLNWHLQGLRSHWGFFPLWLGYCLTVDAIVFKQSGSSLLSRNTRAFITLFLISFPFWWLFEALDERTQFWHYTNREQFSDLEYFLLASLSFSTVLPAIFCTSELTSSLFQGKKLNRWIRLGSKKWQQITFFVMGWIMLAIVLFIPRYGAPFLWISIYFIIDPLNVWLGHRSLLAETGKGNWGPVWSLWSSSLICGFFWEMWNFYSNPKWYYTIPGVDSHYVFEMPLLGYLGYLPFALELFAMYYFIVGILRLDSLKSYLHI